MVEVSPENSNNVSYAWLEPIGTSGLCIRLQGGESLRQITCSLTFESTARPPDQRQAPIFTNKGTAPLKLDVVNPIPNFRRIDNRVRTSAAPFQLLPARFFVRFQVRYPRSKGRGPIEAINNIRPR